MSVVCQFNQHGHCKFGSKCDKFHTIATCANFPCQQDSECNLRHPRLCKYFSAYGRCMFADKCSFLHYSFNRGHHHAASNGLQEIMQAVAEMKEEVKTLRLEVDRLGNVNANLLEMIKDLKEEVDVDRVKRQGLSSSSAMTMRMFVARRCKFWSCSSLTTSRTSRTCTSRTSTRGEREGGRRRTSPLHQRRTSALGEGGKTPVSSF